MLKNKDDTLTQESIGAQMFQRSYYKKRRSKRSKGQGAGSNVKDEHTETESGSEPLVPAMKGSTR